MFLLTFLVIIWEAIANHEASEPTMEPTVDLYYTDLDMQRVDAAYESVGIEGLPWECEYGDVDVTPKGTTDEVHVAASCENGLVNQVVIFNYWSLTTLPAEFFENLAALPSLWRVAVSYSGLTSLSDAVGLLTQIQWLELDYNSLTTLPDSIGGLTSLTELSIHDTALSTIPTSIRLLTSLEMIFVHNNKLTTVPDLSELTNIERVWIKGNPYLFCVPRLPAGKGPFTTVGWSPAFNADQMAINGGVCPTDTPSPTPQPTPQPTWRPTLYPTSLPTRKPTASPVTAEEQPCTDVGTKKSCEAISGCRWSERVCVPGAAIDCASKTKRSKCIKMDGCVWSKLTSACEADAGEVCGTYADVRLKKKTKILWEGDVDNSCDCQTLCAEQRKAVGWIFWTKKNGCTCYSKNPVRKATETSKSRFIIDFTLLL